MSAQGERDPAAELDISRISPVVEEYQTVAQSSFLTKGALGLTTTGRAGDSAKAANDDLNAARIHEETTDGPHVYGEEDDEMEPKKMKQATEKIRIESQDLKMKSFKRQLIAPSTLLQKRQSKPTERHSQQITERRTSDRADLQENSAGESFSASTRNNGRALLTASKPSVKQSETGRKQALVILSKHQDDPAAAVSADRKRAGANTEEKAADNQTVLRSNYQGTQDTEKAH